jgi:hypothetical protein
MSDRNTALLLRGHVPAPTVAAAVRAAFGPLLAELTGGETPRLGHGERLGQPFTLLSLRLFEVAGLRVLDEGEMPDSDEAEVALAAALSAGGGAAVYVHYDEERGAGGHALWRNGELASRRYYDGRGFGPVLRDLEGEHEIAEPDEGDWIWDLIGDAVEEGATPVLGPGVRTDDDLEAVIQAGGAEPLDLTAPPPPPPPATADRRRGVRARLKGWLKR